MRRPGEPIPLAPMPPDEALSLRLLQREGHPDVHVATDVFSWWWLSPLVSEGPAPMPQHAFTHTAGVLAELALRDDVGGN